MKKNDYEQQDDEQLENETQFQRDQEFTVDVDGARAEILNKDYGQIQHETALKWAARGLAAYELSAESETIQEAIGWLELGNEFTHEALEHAALVEDGGELLVQIGQSCSEEKHKTTSILFGESTDADGDGNQEIFEEPQAKGDEAVSNEGSAKELVDDVVGNIEGDGEDV